MEGNPQIPLKISLHESKLDCRKFMVIALLTHLFFRFIPNNRRIPGQRLGCLAILLEKEWFTMFTG